MHKIVTHSGGYHADDIFAVTCLQMLIGEGNVQISRTRDLSEIQNADYVVDVGEVYDQDKELFDHHQSGGAGKRENGIPYASFGLVWKKYGKELSGGQREADIIDQKLVQPIDAGDNGLQIFTPNKEGVFPYMIQTMFSSFKPIAEEDVSPTEVFMEMLPLARRILEREVFLSKNYVKAETEIEDVYKDSEDKRVVVFDDGSLDRGVIGDVLSRKEDSVYAVFKRKDDGLWQVLALPTKPGLLDQRQPLQKDLSVDGLKFIHNAGFMALCETKESALELAKKALEK